MPREGQHPSWFRLYYDEAKPIVDMLPRAQAQKVIGAMALYFLFSMEPTSLSRQGRFIFESHRNRLDRYRTSVTNGMKNKGKPSKNEAKTRQETGKETDFDF